MGNNYLISIVGAPGTGKTTLCNELSTRLQNVNFIFEDVSKNIYLERFYEDPQKWSFHSRISIFAMHLQNYTKIDRTYPICIMDKCIPELIVYAKRAYDRGDMDAMEFKLYSQLFEATNALIPQVDLFIYLTCTPETCVKRIISRGRDCEKNISIDYMVDVVERYNNWAKTIPDDHIWVIDTEKGLDYEEIVDRIKKLRGI